MFFNVCQKYDVLSRHRCTWLQATIEPPLSKVCELFTMFEKFYLPNCQNSSCLVLLDAGADVNAKDKGGLIALHNAASYGHYEVVKLLVEVGRPFSNSIFLYIYMYFVCFILFFYFLQIKSMVLIRTLSTSGTSLRCTR